MSRPERPHILATMRLTKMTQDLLIGIVALIAAVSLQFYAAPMVYPAIVLIFFALGIAEVITWAVTADARPPGRRDVDNHSRAAIGIENQKS
jgi:hypothetical protein